MVIILMGLIVFGAILIVGYPLVNAQDYEYAEAGLNGDEGFEHLASARNSAFEAIRDLEFDRATGKLSDTDYKTMRARFDARAAEILQKMDAVDAAKAKRAAQPAVAAAAKSERSGAAAVQPGGTPPVPSVGAKKSFCGHCGAHVQAADRFCPVCGTRLT